MKTSVDSTSLLHFDFIVFHPKVGVSGNAWLQQIHPCLPLFIGVKQV
jgi:hypothetical protein